MAIRTLANSLFESAPAAKPAPAAPAPTGTITVPATLAPRLLVLESSLPAAVKPFVTAVHTGQPVAAEQIQEAVEALYKLSDGSAGPLAARLAKLAPAKLNESAEPKQKYAGHQLIKESSLTRSGKMFCPPPAKLAKVAQAPTDLVEGLKSGKIKNVKWREASNPNVIVEGHVVAVDECKGVGTVVTAVTADYKRDARLHVRDLIV